MGKYFMQVCRNNGLRVQSQHLFDRLTLPEFLKGKVCFVCNHCSCLTALTKNQIHLLLYLVKSKRNIKLLWQTGFHSSIKLTYIKL